jgi:DNA-directed RNA polymerase subunit M/transcription elongation factor TFIIS
MYDKACSPEATTMDRALIAAGVGPELGATLLDELRSLAKGSEQRFVDGAVALLCAMNPVSTAGSRVRAELKGENPSARRVFDLVKNARKPATVRKAKAATVERAYEPSPCRNCGATTVRKRMASARAADEGQIAFLVCHSCNAQWRSG